MKTPEEYAHEFLTSAGARGYPVVEGERLAAAFAACQRDAIEAAAEILDYDAEVGGLNRLAWAKSRAKKIRALLPAAPKGGR